MFGSLTLGACQGDRETFATAPSTDTETPASGRPYYIESGPIAILEMVLASTEDILIRGAGVVDDSYPNADSCGSSDDGFEFPLPIRH